MDCHGLKWETHKPIRRSIGEEAVLPQLEENTSDTSLTSGAVCSCLVRIPPGGSAAVSQLARQIALVRVPGHQPRGAAGHSSEALVALHVPFRLQVRRGAYVGQLVLNCVSGRARAA